MDLTIEELKKKISFDEISIISKDILYRMTKRHYSKVSLMGILDAIQKTGHSKENILAAMLFMEKNKLIKIHKTEHFSGAYLELLDDGIGIKNTMIGCYHDDQSFGIVYYEPGSMYDKTISCHDHLDKQVELKKSIIDTSCVKCFNERAQRICLEHNQSLEFCTECKIKAAEFLELGKILGFDEVWDKIKDQHHKEYWAN